MSETNGAVRICSNCKQWAHFHGAGPDCEQTENDLEIRRLREIEAELAESYRAIQAIIRFSEWCDGTTSLIRKNWDIRTQRAIDTALAAKGDG